uniref:Interleukin 17 receptor E n=1 Tax=Leptobrachium leishanense TaxID=445787 RepID=A0A8C5QWU7_9ANUR
MVTCACRSNTHLRHKSASTPEVDAGSTRLGVHLDPRRHWNAVVKRVSFHKMNPKTLLPPDVFTVYTEEWCDPMMDDCNTCLHINITLNATGLLKIKGFIVQEMSQDYAMKIVKYKKSQDVQLWSVQLECCAVETDQDITVALFTVPDLSLGIIKTYSMSEPDPQELHFHFEHFPERREIVVSLTEGLEANTRLCYDNFLCDTLRLNESDVIQKVSTSKNTTLRYDYLLPCLCIEAFYDGPNSLRKQKCPFREYNEAYNTDFWNIFLGEVEDNSSMVMYFVKRCYHDTHVSLCEKKGPHCSTIHDAVIKTQDIETDDICQVEYSLADVDIGPNLCFQFEVSNRRYVKCPDLKDRLWDASVELQLFNTLITISTEKALRFNVEVCKPNNNTGQCDPLPPVYNFTTDEEDHQGAVQVTIPKLALGHCVKVWRSDVRFSHKYLFCPDFSHKHLGLVSLGLALAVFTLFASLFLIYQRIWKTFTAPLWRRTVLLVYTPDSPEYKILICAFADFLQKILGCEVILDLWDMTTISQIGMMPWFSKKRELVSERKGSVIFVWSKRTMSMYKKWTTSTWTTHDALDPVNLFGAAMAFLHKDLESGVRKEILSNYSVVYFEGLCEKQDIPNNFRKLSRYRLLKDFYRLVSKLQDTPCLPPRCLIKAVAKYLMRKLISSERTMGLKKNLEHCRQRLHEGVR